MDDFIAIDDDFEQVNPSVNENVDIKNIELTDIINDSINDDTIIGIDNLLVENEEVIDVYEEIEEKERHRQKIISRIQIGLILFLIVFAGLVYLFGYDFVEPYIKID